MIELVRRGRLRETGLETGIASEDELEEMAKAWEEWVEKDDATLAMMQGEIMVQK